MNQGKTMKERDAYAACFIADCYFLKGYCVKWHPFDNSLEVEGKRLLVKAITQKQHFLVLNPEELFRAPDGLVLCEVDFQATSCSFLGSISYQEFLEEATIASSPMVITSMEGKQGFLPKGGAALEKGFLLDDLLLPEDIKAA